MPTSYLLRDAVERAIMSYHPIRTSETDINIDVQANDQVILNGYVRTDVMRSVASRLARNVRGVRSVRNNLYSDTDLEIMIGQAIELRLGSYIVPMMPGVRAIRGHIFLRGPIASENAKQIVAESALMSPGVVAVHNSLTVDPEAVERLVAPKKRATVTTGADSGAAQAMVGGKPVTAEDLPKWALMPKEQWAMAEYKARAKTKMAWKKGEGPDPKEMEEAGAILRAAADSAGAAPAEAAPAAAPDAAIDLSFEEEEDDDGGAPVMDLAALKEQYPAWALKPKEEWDKSDFKAQMQAKRAFKKGDGEDPKVIVEQAQAAFKAVMAPLEALKGQYPDWALKPKEEWNKADFKGQMQAKRAFKKGDGEDPKVILENAQAALKAAMSGGKKKKRKPKNSKEAAIAAVREQYPGWAILPRKQWGAQDFAEAADARIVELNGQGQALKEVRQAAQEALEAALRGEEVKGGGVAKRRDLTPAEIAAVRQELTSQYPVWALKPKEEWQMADYKGQMRAKRASKGGEGDPPKEIIEKAQDALKAALQAAWEALPLETEGSGKRELTPEEIVAVRDSLIGEYPGWALKPKEEWDRQDFKAQMKAKRAFKKDQGESPDATIEKAQAALAAALEKAASA
ncbi:MAG: BON domain-containing protein [Ardenticatenaceae bacterium]